MSLWLVISVGGFIGAILRFIISGWIQNGVVTFPLGTLGVNFLGSFFVSLVLYLSEYRGFFSEEIRIFLTIGVLGSFTTMSTFSFESFKLLEQGEIGALSLNVAATLILTFLAVYLGKIAVVNIGWE